MRFPRPHPVDLLMGLGGLSCGLVLWWFGLYVTGDHLFGQRWATLVPLAVMAATEAVRRTAPRTALVVATLAIAGDQLTNGNLATVLMFTDVVYAAVVYGPPASARRIPYATALVTVALTVVLLIWWQNAVALLVGVLSGMIAFMPAVTGAVVRNHRNAAEAARLQAEQTALLAEMDRREAVVAERARMARELHDMVAGHLSAIAIHSTAALSLDDPGTSRDALGVIRENSVEGLAEMRRLITLLRDGDTAEEPAPAPTLAGLPALVRQAETAGTPSALTFTLDAPARDALPAPVELAAYRIVQESLTNALKHAAPGPVHVSLQHTGHALTVHVSSPYGEAPPGPPRAPGSGAGLVGMRERVALLGGEFGAGPVEEDGRTLWRVRAQLPVSAELPVRKDDKDDKDDKEPSA